MSNHVGTNLGVTIAIATLLTTGTSIPPELIPSQFFESTTSGLMPLYSDLESMSTQSPSDTQFISDVHGYEILTRFVENLLKNTIDISPEAANFVEDNFWDLI